MSRLQFNVDVGSDDNNVDVEYLKKLRDIFISIVGLASWGYTNDEILVTSHMLHVTEDSK